MKECPEHNNRRASSRQTEVESKSGGGQEGWRLGRPALSSPVMTSSDSEALHIELSYLGSTWYNTVSWTLHNTIKKMFSPDLDCNNPERKDQCLHASWHSVPSTKYVFAE